MAAASHDTRKGPFFKSAQSRREARFNLTRSLSINIKGIPVPRTRKQKIGKVHARPTLSMSACETSGRTVAPRSPSALKIPCASPSFVKNNRSGRVEVIANKRAPPIPNKTPAITKSPPMLFRVKLVQTRPRPQKVTAAKLVHQVPKVFVSLIANSPPAIRIANPRLTTKVIA